MALEPPPFQEADRCDVCKCSFNTFRRRHHCRCCGRTLCHEHSSSQMALPQFNINTAVRVCADCFNDSTRSAKADSKAFPNAVNNVTDEVSRLDIHSEAESKTEATTQLHSNVTAIECKCGMPLCICAAPAPTTEARPLQMKAPSTSISQSNPKPKKPDPTPKNRGSTSNSRNSSLFNHGQTTNDSHGTPQRDYEVNGEGLREAIKSGDTAAVRKLLSEGVDANYRDKQGLSLLHLAALFNRTDIVFILMESGASMDYKNAQGETPLDCAPVTLQYKMKQKIEESGQ